MSGGVHVETAAEKRVRMRQRGFTTADYRAARAIREQLLATPDSVTLESQLRTPDWVVTTAKLIAQARIHTRKQVGTVRRAT